MSGIMVATDFSVRSDRAIRRGVLTARVRAVPLTLVHVVDDDQPVSIIAAERTAAEALLARQARSLRELDGVDCDHRVVLGDPFAGIVEAGDLTEAELLVIGPHRRQALRDIFRGTTAERVIRTGRRPILMANGVPAGPHRNILIAVDLSEHSAEAVRTAAALVLTGDAAVSVLHVYDAPGTGPLAGAGLSRAQAADYLRDEEAAAGAALARFLAGLQLRPDVRLLRPGATSAAQVILGAARELSADLVVLATHGRTGIAKMMLGSVTEAVLAMAETDVLAAPPADRAT